MQITSGIRSVLSAPMIYNLVQNLVGARRYRDEIVRRYIQPETGDRILDVGCGTGDVLQALPKVEYFGCDISPEYISTARRRFGNRGTFVCQALDADLIRSLPVVDRVISIGVLHHLSDDEALDMMRLAKSALKPGGRFITVDGTFEAGQSRIARFIIARDRGQAVRTPDGYRALAEQVFDSVDVAVRHDLNRIPYTHAILTATR